MILTTGEIGLIAVGATLVGVFVTLSIDRKRFSAARKERWFDDRRDAYANFLKSVNHIKDVCNSVTALLLADKKDKLPEKLTKNYSTNAEAANESLTIVRLVGSSRAGNEAQRIVNSQKAILALHPHFNKDAPKDLDTGIVDKASAEYRNALKEFTQIIRHEFGVAEQPTEKPGQLPDTALVLASRWIRRKLYESYIRSQDSPKKD